jgi:hypothetical protein
VPQTSSSSFDFCSLRCHSDGMFEELGEFFGTPPGRRDRQNLFSHTFLPECAKHVGEARFLLSWVPPMVGKAAGSMAFLGEPDDNE